MWVLFNMQLCPADCLKTKDVPLLTGGVATKAHYWLYFQSNRLQNLPAERSWGLRRKAKHLHRTWWDGESLALSAETVHGLGPAATLLKFWDLREMSKQRGIGQDYISFDVKIYSSLLIYIFKNWVLLKMPASFVAGNLQKLLTHMWVLLWILILNRHPTSSAILWYSCILWTLWADFFHINLFFGKMWMSSE